MSNNSSSRFSELKSELGELQNQLAEANERAAEDSAFARHIAEEQAREQRMFRMAQEELLEQQKEHFEDQQRTESLYTRNAFKIEENYLNLKKILRAIKSGKADDLKAWVQLEVIRMALEKIRAGQSAPAQRKQLAEIRDQLNECFEELPLESLKTDIDLVQCWALGIEFKDTHLEQIAIAAEQLREVRLERSLDIPPPESVARTDEQIRYHEKCLSDLKASFPEKLNADIAKVAQLVTPLAEELPLEEDKEIYVKAIMSRIIENRNWTYESLTEYINDIDSSAMEARKAILQQAPNASRSRVFMSIFPIGLLVLALVVSLSLIPLSDFGEGLFERLSITDELSRFFETDVAEVLSVWPLLGSLLSILLIAISKYLSRKIEAFELNVKTYADWLQDRYNLYAVLLYDLGHLKAYKGLLGVYERWLADEKGGVAVANFEAWRPDLEADVRQLLVSDDDLDDDLFDLD